MKKHNIKRRNFLKSVGACTLCSGIPSLILGNAALANEYISYNNNEVVVDKAVFSKEKAVLLNPPNNDFPISLLDLGQDNYSALLMSCTHQKCTTKWNKDHYVCPCHGSRFTETGEVIRGLAQESLKSYSVTVSDTHITVELS